MSLYNQGYEEVQYSVDEQRHEDDKEGMAKQVDESIIRKIYAKARESVVQVISIQHGEQCVERLGKGCKLQGGMIVTTWWVGRGRVHQ